MKEKRRKVSPETKIKIIEEIRNGKGVAQTAREYGFAESVIYRWKKEYETYEDKAFAGNGNIYKDSARIAELERLVGQLTMEKELLKKTLQKLKEREQLKKEIGEA